MSEEAEISPRSLLFLFLFFLGFSLFILLCTSDMYNMFAFVSRFSFLSPFWFLVPGFSFLSFPFFSS